MKKLPALLLSLSLWTLTPGLASAGVYEDVLQAVKTGNKAELIALLDRGVDVNTSDAAGHTLVMIAAREGHAELIDVLARARAKLNARNKDGDSALRLAAFYGHKAAVVELVGAGAQINMSGWNPLTYAAYAGHQDIAEYLIKHGADVNAPADNGSTPLMIAARNGFTPIVRVLLLCDAKVNVVNQHEQAALDLARKGNHSDIAAMLEKAGARTAAELAAAAAPESKPEAQQPAEAR